MSEAALGTQLLSKSSAIVGNTPPMQSRPVDSELEKHKFERQNLKEWSSLLCIWYSILTTVAILLALLFSDFGERWTAVDVDEVWHSKAAIMMVSSAVIMELCFLASSSLNVRTLGVDCRNQLCLNGVGDSVLTLIEYSLKILTGFYLWCAKGGIVHTDVLAVGGPRPVYMARFLQWSVAVPLLMLLSNRSFCSKDTEVWDCIRWMPGLVASSVYCWAGWIMEVTVSPKLRWPFFFLSMVGAVFASIDQIVLARHHRGKELWNWKFGMLVYQIASFALYALVFVLGRFGLVSSLFEQCSYAYADATVKVLQGALLAMIRNRDDLNAIKRWWVAALNATHDLENIISTACVPVFAIDLEGRIVDWNDNLHKLTGRHFESVRGKPLLDLVTPECREAVQAGIQHAVQISRAAADQAEENSNWKRDDDDFTASKFATNFVELSIPVAKARGNEAQTRNLAMTLVPKSTQGGALAGVMAIGQDLSDLAQLKIVQERKSALIAMLSHEIRSPLHGMVGLTTAMLESSAGAAMKRQLGMVKGCAVRLLDLVTNIMDLAQNEKRRLDGRPQERPQALVDFGAIVDEVHTMTKMAVDKMNKPLLKPSVRFVNKLEGERTPLVRGDPQKCTQLIYNLVTNACKFTQRGAVTVSARHDEERKRLEIEVADTGSGISKEGQRRIFYAFEQEQTGDTRGFQGIGLGLAVCSEISELHGGELRVSSELGHGSKFIASFPCEENLGYGGVFGDSTQSGGSLDLASPGARSQPPASVATSTPAVAAPGPAQTDQQPVAQESVWPHTPLVLSVDDDEVNQEVIRTALAGVGDVHCAMDGLQALKYLQDRRSLRQRMPDIVLLDIQMPGMSGFEVCSEIRQKLQLGHFALPIIMISARAPTDQTAIEGYEIGTTDFVAKPFNSEVLKRKVMAVLQTKAESGAVACENQSMQLKSKLFEQEQKVKSEEDRAEKTEKALKGVEEQLKAAQAGFPPLPDDSRAKELQDRLDASESSVKSLQGRLQAAEATAASLQERLLSKESDAAELQERLEASEAKAERLQQQLNEAGKHQGTDTKFQELAGSMERLRKQLERSERFAAERAERAAMAVARVATLSCAKAMATATEETEASPRALVSSNLSLGDGAGTGGGPDIFSLAARGGSVGEAIDGRRASAGSQNNDSVDETSPVASYDRDARPGAVEDASVLDETTNLGISQRVVRSLLSQLANSRATVKVLGSRLEILSAVALGSLELLENPSAQIQHDDIPLEMGCLQDKLGQSCDALASLQLQSYKDTAHLVCAQLALMAQISSSSDLTTLPRGMPAGR